MVGYRFCLCLLGPMIFLIWACGFLYVITDKDLIILTWVQCLPRPMTYWFEAQICKLIALACFHCVYRLVSFHCFFLGIWRALSQEWKRKVYGKMNGFLSHFILFYSILFSLILCVCVCFFFFFFLLRLRV